MVTLNLSAPNGQTATVTLDRHDYDRIIANGWHFSIVRNTGRLYVRLSRQRNNNREFVYLHRYIMGAVGRHQHVHHRNALSDPVGAALHNCRENLVLLDHSQHRQLHDADRPAKRDLKPIISGIIGAPTHV